MQGGVHENFFRDDEPDVQRTPVEEEDATERPNRKAMILPKPTPKIEVLDPKAPSAESGQWFTGNGRLPTVQGNAGISDARKFDEEERTAHILPSFVQRIEAGPPKVESTQLCIGEDKVEVPTIHEGVNFGVVGAPPDHIPDGSSDARRAFFSNGDDGREMPSFHEEEDSAPAPHKKSKVLPKLLPPERDSGTVLGGMKVDPTSPAGVQKEESLMVDRVQAAFIADFPRRSDVFGQPEASTRDLSVDQPSAHKDEPKADSPGEFAEARNAKDMNVASVVQNSDASETQPLFDFSGFVREFVSPAQGSLLK
jgi:hypothetical protein